MSEPSILRKSSGSIKRDQKSMQKRKSTKLKKQQRSLSKENQCSSVISADREDRQSKSPRSSIEEVEAASIEASRKKDEMKWKAKALQLEKEVDALRMHLLGMSSELRYNKATLEEEQMALQVLETEQLDLRHDLEEAQKVRRRLEHENVILRKKLQKRDSDNEALQYELNQLKGISPEPDLPFEFEESDPSLFLHDSSKGKTIWSILSESLKNEDAFGSRNQSTPLSRKESRSVSPKLSRSTTVDSLGKGGLFRSFSALRTSTILAYEDVLDA
jgi:hypothetical protein